MAYIVLLFYSILNIRLLCVVKEEGREVGVCVGGGGGGGQIKSSVVSRGYGSLHFHFVL